MSNQPLAHETSLLVAEITTKSHEDLLASYREYMVAAVTVGEIDEGTALYVGDILQNIIRQTTPTTPA